MQTRAEIREYVRENARIMYRVAMEIEERKRNMVPSSSGNGPAFT